MRHFTQATYILRDLRSLAASTRLVVLTRTKKRAADVTGDASEFTNSLRQNYTLMQIAQTRWLTPFLRRNLDLSSLISRAKGLDLYPDLTRRVGHLGGVITVRQNAVESAQIVQDLHRFGVQHDFNLRAAGVDKGCPEYFACEG